jgi:RHS repeat-associated protein
LKRTDFIPFSCFDAEFAAREIGAYRYSFNGKELDKPGMGGGQSTYDYGFRIYNPAIAKFLSVDPLTREYPWYTPYQFAGNKPIWAIDLDGLEELKVTTYVTENEDCSVHILTHTEVLEKADPLGSGVLNLVIFTNTGDFCASFNKNEVMIEAERSEGFFESSLNSIEKFFDPKHGFEFSSENGSLSYARYGTGEKIEDIDALLAAVSGLHAVASSNGNPLVSTNYTKNPDDLNKAFDFWYARLGGILDNVEAISNSTRNVDDVTNPKSSYIVTEVDSHPARVLIHEQEHNNIDEDSLKKVENTLGTRKEGNSKITRSIRPKK